MENQEAKNEALIGGAGLNAGLERLLPCPFCGKGKTEFISNGMIWMGMGFSEPVSISINHWCEHVEGQPERPVQRIGRDRESAIAAWNLRSNVELRGCAGRGCKTMKGETNMENQEAKNEALIGGAGLNAELDLLDRINAHLRQLAPHQKERDGVVLLTEARDELSRLKADKLARFKAQEEAQHWIQQRTLTTATPQ